MRGKERGEAMAVSRLLFCLVLFCCEAYCFLFLCLSTGHDFKKKKKNAVRDWG